MPCRPYNYKAVAPAAAAGLPQVDNLPPQVDNRAELLTKLYFREELHARTRRAPAGCRRCRSPVALIRPPRLQAVAALARTAARRYYNHIIITLLHTCYI